MNQEQQPEALRLADALENYAYPCNVKAAAELRRLHAHVQELEAQQMSRDCQRPECMSHGCVGHCMNTRR